ncbi:hypothetical protein NLI96_g3123 [Meripilus lineatus]|uniref:Uncharacterized protein n=1 Tax=Meripilus lineatus TaxID=2056292 RepID=A0AAD5VCS2_9APHY|nr:hypothetical protein NLI96_g3123 [Physisporinus lineatus]
MLNIKKYAAIERGESDASDENSGSIEFTLIRQCASQRETGNASVGVNTHFEPEGDNVPPQNGMGQVP